MTSFAAHASRSRSSPAHAEALLTCSRRSLLTPKRSAPAPWLTSSARIIRLVLPRRARSALAVVPSRRARRELVTIAVVPSQRAPVRISTGEIGPRAGWSSALASSRKALFCRLAPHRAARTARTASCGAKKRLILPACRGRALRLGSSSSRNVPWPLGSLCSFSREHGPLGRLDDAACIAAGSLEGSLWVPSPARHVPVRSCTASSDGRRHASSRMLR